MNYKGAIKYINGFNVTCNKERKNNLKQVELLLQRGEENVKYKQIVEQLKQNYGQSNVRFGFGEGETLEHAINHLMWLYFPKPKSKLVKLIQELDKAVKEILEEVTK